MHRASRVRRMKSKREEEEPRPARSSPTENIAVSSLAHQRPRKIDREHSPSSLSGVVRRARGGCAKRKVSPPPSTTITTYYHEATIITVARLAVINHATGMIRLNCCSHVSALEARNVWVVLHGRSRAELYGGDEERGWREQRQREGYATFPHHVVSTSSEERPARPGRERQCPSRAVITHAFQ